MHEFFGNTAARQNFHYLKTFFFSVYGTEEKKKKRRGRGGGERITIINKHKNPNEVIIIKNPS